MRATVNGNPQEITADMSITDLIRTLGLEGRRLAVEINGDIVPRSQHAERRIEDGDVIEIVHAIGGGSY